MRKAPMHAACLFCGALVLICLLVGNIHAVSPKVPYRYDPATRSMVRTPMPLKPAGMDQPEAAPGAVLGSRPCLVILLEFTDHPADQVAHPSSAFDDLIFSTGVIPTGSMKEYYEEVSYNQFTVNGQVTSWLTAPQTYAYYVGGNYGWGTAYPANAQGMAYDACALVDPSIDFSLYDSDGPDGIPNSGDDDGYVDGLFIVHAGPGAEESGNVNDIWSHKWSIPGGYMTNDAAFGGGNIWVYTYSTEPEEFTDGSLQTMGVFAHEFCHVLGMPDLYDYDDGYINQWDDDNRPLFDWCLMSHGSWGGPSGWGDGSVPAHPSAWIKYQLGWITPTTLSSSSYNIPIDEIGLTNGANSLYKVLINDFGGVEEYFLIANRNPGSSIMFDKYDNNNYSGGILKDSGVLIYHVDERYPVNDDGPADARYAVWTEDPGMVPVDTLPTTNVDGPHYQLKSDAAYSMEDGQIDFNLNTGFPYHYLYPNSDMNDGGTSGIAVQVASGSGPTMLFHLGIGHGAEVHAPMAEACNPGESVDFDFTVKNPGGFNENYYLTATSANGFTLSYTPLIGPVGPFEEITATVTLTVPSSQTVPTVDVIKLRAACWGDMSVWDEAITQAPVATAITSFEAVASGDGIRLRSEFSAGTGVRYVNIYRGEDDTDLAFYRKVEGSFGMTFEYIDHEIEPGKSYCYQIGVVDDDGEFLSPTSEVNTPEGKVSLGWNYPNPFNPVTTITFTLPAVQHATLDIFNVEGKLVKRLFDGVGSSGVNSMEWDGTNANGLAVSSGVYYYRLSTEDHFRETRKMILLR
jgi:M6 family metalloprotease-like protein